MMQAVGSAYYVAPEVLVAGEGPNDGGYDETCDVWSMGVIAYAQRALSGASPLGDEKLRPHSLFPPLLASLPAYTN